MKKMFWPKNGTSKPQNGLSINIYHDIELGVDRARILPARAEPSYKNFGSSRAEPNEFFKNRARAEPAYHRAEPSRAILCFEKTKFLPSFIKTIKIGKYVIYK